MADITFAMNAFSILGGAQMRVRPNGGNQNEGGVEVRSGSFVWETDDIVVFNVSGAGADGGIDQNSTITGITVYDNATAYLNDLPKFTYTGTGTIRGNNAGVGDNYLRLNVNGLTSSDAGAPDLNQLFLVAGQDLSSIANGGGPTFFDQFSDNDYDQNDTIDGGTEPADGIFHGGAGGNDIYLVLCFARGTLIETPQGPRYIETLAKGYLVNTLDDGPQPIRWIGATTMAGTGPNAPVVIRAGALGNLRDLVVSQNHRMLVRGAEAELLFGEPDVLVAAKHLVNGDTIRIAPCETVEYFHLLCEDHQIVFAECCPAETLYPGEQALRCIDDTARDEITRIFPELTLSDTTMPLSRYALRGFEARALLNRAA
ncbi:Hint domain-containing protein [Thalassococcus sp. CAU 1522]|uniref:Hint domain-containing protein n=1 Tax=Thalassococcus arenae TaxID=2851652 RepID=A0ABS6N3N7_9RHOB|nr:Hint domain-containing protein [Thalassococcus arenae]MBV2358262.1 Hint domain-containing protein [Thalassococcus arenae]